MKKLMIAAAGAAMIGGAYAAGTICADAEIRETSSAVCDDATISYEVANCRVYDFAVTLKTLAPKKLTCKACKYECAESTTVTYLDNATLKLNGYVWTCAEECVEDYAGAYVALWNKSTKTPVIPLGYNLIGGTTARQDPMAFDIFELVRYGKKATSVAAYWELDGSSYDIACPLFLVGAGVNGKGEKYTEFCYEDEDLNAKAYGLLLKSISGNVAGHFGLSQIWKKVCAGTIVYDIEKVLMCECWYTWCDELDVYDDGDLVPATGTWSLKYNKKLSTANKSMLTIVPSYALVER